MAKKESGRKLDPVKLAKLATAVESTSMTGKSSEQWADEAWDKATGKGRR